MKDETAENLHQWMATASPEGKCIYCFIAWHLACTPFPFTERQTVLKMLKSVEEAQVHDVSGSIVLQQ